MTILQLVRTHAHSSAVCRYSFAILGLVALAGCSVTITAPPDQATVAAPSVPVNVTLPNVYRPNTFKAMLGDQDVTPQFTVNTQAGVATATLTITPGVRKLDVTACWGINIYFVQQPPFPFQGCSSASSGFTVVNPTLIAGSTTLKVGVSRMVTTTVRAVPPPTSNLTVTLSSSPTGRVTLPTSVTIPANSAATVNVQVDGVAPGTTTLTASAAPYAAATQSIAVAPIVTLLTPATGPGGTSVNVTGAGFVAPVTAKLGTSNVMPMVMSGTQLSFVVPAGAAVGSNIPFTVTSAMQTSDPVNFAVTAGTATTDFAMFRGTNDRVEIIVFTLRSPFNTSTFQLLGSVPTPLSPGMLNVGMCRNATQLAWTGGGNAVLFTIGGTPTAPTLTQVAATPVTPALTGNGTACALLSSPLAALVRGTDMGVETFNPSVNPMTKFGQLNGGASSSGVSMISSGARVWRSHTTGLEEYSLSAAGAPSLVVNVITNMTGSPVGTDMDWLTPGATLVRATALGVDVVSVTGAPTRIGFDNTVGASSTGVGFSILGTRGVRGTNTGIETFDLTTPSTPVRCAFRINGAGASATGVDVVARSGVAFRATNLNIEAFDISDMACPSPANGTQIPAPVIFQTGLGTSTTGVALIGR